MWIKGTIYVNSWTLQLRYYHRREISTKPLKFSNEFPGTKYGKQYGAKKLSIRESDTNFSHCSLAEVKVKAKSSYQITKELQKLELTFELTKRFLSM